MINYIYVTNSLNETLELDLRNPFKNGFAVEGITGLGQGSASINLTDYATLPGSYWTGSRKGTRNIVINLMLLWANTVEQARHTCNRYFPIMDELTLRFVTEERECWIKGRVETNDPIIFTTNDRKPGIQCSISLLCSEPSFKSTNLVRTKYSNLESGFHFSFPYKYEYNGWSNCPPADRTVHNTFQFCRMIVSKTRTPDVNIIQMSGIQFRNPSTNTLFSFATATCTGNLRALEWTQGYDKLIDNSNSYLSVEYLGGSLGDLVIDINMGHNKLNALEYSKFEWTRADAESRDPVSWKVMLSNDPNFQDESTFVISEENDYDVPTTAYATVCSIPYTASYVTYGEVKVHMGIIGRTQRINVVSDSDHEHGIIFELSFNSSARKVIITAERTGESICISPPGNFSAGDVLIINTTRGEKSIKCLRDGAYYNFLQYKTAESKFITVLPGSNNFTYSVDDGEMDYAVTVYTDYKDQYWSV